MTNYQLEGREWWVERWLDLLNSYRFKKRLERARIYAREGNVLSIDFEGNQVIAKVQGSEADPYLVSLHLALFTDEDWDYVIETLSEKAIFSAQLLAGQMPKRIEEVFTANGLSLFPFKLSEIRSRCSCPDKANPCKHIGAVYYQLGDRFSEDPFVLFQLRGRTKAQILEQLRQLRRQTLDKTDSEQTEAFSSEEDSPQSLEEMPPSEGTEDTQSSAVDLTQFWRYEEPLESSLVVIAPSPDSQSLLDLLGPIPLAYDDAQAVQQYLKQVYQTAREQALMTALNRDE